jgi:hypothetical protein
MGRVTRRSLASGSLLFVASLTFAGAASAQAFLPSRGEGSVSFLFQDTRVDRHLAPDGRRSDNGRIQADGVLIDLTYGITETTAISMTVPFLAAKYTGVKPHPGSLVDDGRYHGGMQDLRFELRHNVLRGPLAVTPFIGTILPSRDYAFYGHGAIGRDLKELQVGASVARVLDPVIPGTFVQARYAYGFTQRLLDVSHNRSMMDLEIGYFFNPRVRAFGLTSGQISHGGIDLNPPFPFNLPPALIPHHDRISRVNFLEAGGGGQFSVNQSLDFFGSIVHTLSGTNAHAISYGLNLGVTWSFHAGPSAKSTQQRSLYKCLCEKE